MKPFILFLHCLLLGCLTTVSAEQVSLTDTQNRTIEAKILTVAAGTVTVVMENGRQYRIPLSQLNKKSKDTIQNWKLLQLGKKREPFRVSINSFTENEKNSSSQSTKVKTYDEGYKVTVENRTPMKVPALAVKYLILKEAALVAAESNKDVVVDVVKGNAKLEPMGMRETSTFRTKTMPMRESRLRSNWYYTNGGNDNAVDELGGIWIKIMSGDQVIYEYARPSVLPERVKWDHPSS